MLSSGEVAGVFVAVWGWMTVLDTGQKADHGDIRSSQPQQH